MSMKTYFAELLVRFYGVKGLYWMTTEIEAKYLVTDQHRTIASLDCALREVKKEDLVLSHN